MLNPYFNFFARLQVWVQLVFIAHLQVHLQLREKCSKIHANTYFSANLQLWSQLVYIAWLQVHEQVR
jgi:hypothetical protein